LPWQFNQTTGVLSKYGMSIGHGYSGHGEGKNNPALQQVHAVGPIPCGDWTIGHPHDTKDHGPYVMRLDPNRGTETFGRSGFLMHGDSLTDPGNASEGCIVTDRDTRRRVFQSADTTLQVISGSTVPQPLQEIFI